MGFSLSPPALDICVSNWLLPARVKPYPRRLAKYKQRTLKRWARDPRHWLPPQVFLIADAGQVWCHPAAVGTVRQFLAEAYRPMVRPNSVDPYSSMRLGT